MAVILAAAFNRVGCGKGRLSILTLNQKHEGAPRGLVAEEARASICPGVPEVQLILVNCRISSLAEKNFMECGYEIGKVHLRLPGSPCSHTWKHPSKGMWDGLEQFLYLILSCKLKSYCEEARELPGLSSEVSTKAF